jgi:hypothetical protein
MAITNRPIDFSEVPFIPENLDASEIDLLIPKGFESLFKWELKMQTFLVLSLFNSDQENTEIEISASIYNPKASKTQFPKFLFEISSFKSSKKIDYFSTNSNCILNQNQLLYMLLQHRLYMFSEYAKSDQKAFGYLLSGDIGALQAFMDYNTPKAYNAFKKVSNTFVILSPWDRLNSTQLKPVLLDTHPLRLLGEILRQNAYKPSSETCRMVIKDLPVHPSSESSFSMTGKLVVHPYNPSNPLYRSPGYKETGKSFFSIFPPAQNIVARLKTHLISDAIALRNPATSVIAQDCLYDPTTDSYVSRDDCLSESVVVFCRMSSHGRFLAGEIEASPKYVSQQIMQSVSITDMFNEINLKIGESVHCPSGKFVVGVDVQDKPIEVKNINEIKLESLTHSGTLGARKLRLLLTKTAGNARIDSNTGLKGVTKCKPNLGFIEFLEGSYPSLTPDLAVGANAIKAKVNTIVLAGATLAVKMGTYKPKNKWGILDANNVEMVNAAFKSLPKFRYVDEFGLETEVFIGLVYTRFTELAQTYGKAKPMSFMFETGRFLAQNGNKALQKHIWDKYVSETDKKCVDELMKIKTDLTGSLFPTDKLPMYSAKSVTKGSVFSQQDLIETAISTFKSTSKLLDPEWNPNGFLLSFKGMNYNNAPVIRVPSAQTLNMFVNQLPDKTWTYHQVIIRISNILKYCMGTPRYLFVFEQDPSKKRYTELNAYLNEVNKLLYQGAEL